MNDIERSYHAYLEYEFNIVWTFPAKVRFATIRSICESLVERNMDIARCDIAFVEERESSLMTLTATIWVVHTGDAEEPLTKLAMEAFKSVFYKFHCQGETTLLHVDFNQAQKLQNHESTFGKSNSKPFSPMIPFSPLPFPLTRQTSSASRSPDPEAFEPQELGPKVPRIPSNEWAEIDSMNVKLESCRSPKIELYVKSELESSPPQEIPSIIGRV